MTSAKLMDGCFTVAIVNRILLRQITKILCYLLSQMYLLPFVNPVNLCYLVGKKDHIHRPPPKVGKKPTFPKPVPDVKYDLIDQYPEFTEKRGRYRFCPMGYSFVICSKCHITLCLRKDQNCFYDFNP